MLIPMLLAIIPTIPLIRTSAAAPAGDPGQMVSGRHEGVRFVYPQDWSAKKLAQLDGLMIICPQTDGNWQASLFVEARVDRKARSVSEAMLHVQRSLTDEKHNFQLKSRDLLQHPTGFEYGLLVYTCDDRAGTILTERQLVAQMPDGRFFLVQMSAATSALAKYDPVFDRVTESIRLK